MAINPNSILAALWQSGVPGFPQPGGGGFGSLVAPQQGSNEINRQNSSLGGGVPFGIDPPTFRDDTGLVAHNYQLGLASQGAGPGSPSALDMGMQGLSAGNTPAYAERGNPLDYPGIFGGIDSGGVPPTGWFTLKDYYGQKPDSSSSGQVPDQFRTGSTLPSTTDWRQLPPQYRDPNYFMINGQIIDRRAASSEAHGHGVLGQEAGQGDPGFGIGTSAGYPRVQMAGGAGGFLGQQSGRANLWGFGGG